MIIMANLAVVLGYLLLFIRGPEPVRIGILLVEIYISGLIVFPILYFVKDFRNRIRERYYRLPILLWPAMFIHILFTNIYSFYENKICYWLNQKPVIKSTVDKIVDRLYPE
jgi:hypothetical protein